MAQETHDISLTEEKKVGGNERAGSSNKKAVTAGVEAQISTETKDPPLTQDDKGDSFPEIPPEKRTMDVAMDLILKLQSKGPNVDKPRITQEEATEMMKSYVHRLQLDLSKLSIVHVAGTKGKGSTCAMVESILRKKGYRTGLFTSPHLISVCERFRIDGRPISDDVFLHHFWFVWDALQNTMELSNGFSPIPGWFRYLTLVAFHLFIQERVDVLILEVGLGGRLDATNVIDCPIVCGVTTLDLDHTHILGDTIEEIAIEKAGIFKKGIPAFTVAQAGKANEVLQRCANKIDTTLTCVPSICEFKPTKDKDIRLGLKGKFQQVNAGLAVVLASMWLANRSSHHEEDEVLHSFQVGNFSNVLDSVILEALEFCTWPGRSQRVFDESCSNVEFFLDGAHTGKSMDCCVQWYDECSRSFNHGDTFILLFNCHHEKDAGVLLKSLQSQRFDQVIFCPADHSRFSLQKLPTVQEIITMLGIRAVNGSTSETEYKGDKLVWQHTLASVWTALSQSGHNNSCEVVVKESTHEALESIRLSRKYSLASARVLVTGSLYLVGNVLSSIGAKI